MCSVKTNLALKQKAIALRRSGKTYSEVLREVNVAKSTLSLWFQTVQLSKKQTQRITEKRVEAQKRGAQARRLHRLESTDSIYKSAEKEVGQITRRDLFLVGIALYWAEGAKEKVGGTNAIIDFANSDPAMVRIFVHWLLCFGGVKKSEIVVRLHLHASHIYRENEILMFWVKNTGLSLKHFTRTNIKKHNPKTKRRNIGRTYYGLVSVRVRRSTNLNRRIQGLIYGIIAEHKNCQIV
jgi:hypothetical protein